MFENEDYFIIEFFEIIKLFLIFLLFVVKMSKEIAISVSYNNYRIKEFIN